MRARQWRSFESLVRVRVFLTELAPQGTLSFDHALGKLDDPALTAQIARSDRDDSVRVAAAHIQPFLVGRRRRHEGDVHALHELDLVQLDLGEHALLGNPHAVWRARNHRSRLQHPKIQRAGS
mgnify:CR=1 FL=1